MTMTIQKAVVLHCDILGFSNLIRKAESDGTGEILLKLKMALDEAVKIITQFQSATPSAEKIDFRYKIFSDNLYASFAYDESSETSFSDAVIMCFVFARAYYANMLDNEFFVRGAISYGSDYSDESVIFSGALVKAYELERDRACNPRILVEDGLIAKIKQGLSLPGPVTFTVLNNSILIDKDGLYFLNPFELAKDFGVTIAGYTSEHLSKGFIKRHIEYMIKEIAKLNPESDKKILIKYTWLLDLLEWILTDRKYVKDTQPYFKELHFKRDH